MRYRRLLDSDIQISELTFGAARFVTGTQAVNDEKAGKAALAAALEAGINVIHSSYEYETRWALTDVLKSHPKRHELHHVVKVPTPDYADPDFDKAAFRAVIEEAMRELCTEHIAVVQHLQRGVPKAIIYDERGDPERIARMPAINAKLREAFEEIKAEGKVSYLTTFPHMPGYGRAAVQSGAFDGVVAFYNLLNMPMYQLFPEMRRRKMAFFAMQPYYLGVITDKRADRSALPADDPKRQPEWDGIYARFEQIQEELGREVKSWTEMAIKFALAEDIVPTVIVSMNNPDQVAEAVHAVDGDYPDAEFVRRVSQINTKVAA